MTTESERVLDKKMGLELEFRPLVTEAFKKERVAYREAIGNDRLTAEAGVLAAIWSPVLSQHTQVVGQAFTPVIGDPARDTALIQSIQSEMAVVANAQALSITNTSVNDMRRATTEATALLAEEAVVTTAAVAFTGSRILRNLQNARTGTIEITVTQVAAETTRETSFLALGVRHKTWRTVGDTLVRAGHVFANSQRKTINSPFIVAGEPLRFPGDSSLGASAANVINCRCSAEYS